jgi:hypothetical protein
MPARRSQVAWVALRPPGGVDVLLSHEAPAGIPVFGDATVNGFADEKVVAYCYAQRVLLRECPRPRNSDVGVARPLNTPCTFEAALVMFPQ